MNTQQISGASSASNNTNSVESNKALGNAIIQKVEDSALRQMPLTQPSNQGEASLEAGFCNKLSNFFEPFIASQPYERSSEGYLVNPTMQEVDKLLKENAKYRQEHREEYLKIIWSGIEEMMTTLTHPESYHMSPILKPSEDEIRKMQNMYYDLLTQDLSSPEVDEALQDLERSLRIKISHNKPIIENNYSGAYLSAFNSSNTSGQIESIKSKLENCFRYSQSFRSNYRSAIFSMLENIETVTENTHTSEYLRSIESIIDLTILLGKGNWYRSAYFYAEGTITDQEKEMRDLSIKHYQEYQSCIVPHMITWLNIDNGIPETTLNSLRELSPKIKQQLKELNPLKNMFPKG